DVRRRYQSAGDLATDLRQQLEHRPLRHAPEPSWRERGGKWLRRHPRLSAAAGVAAAAAVLVAVLGVVLFAWSHRLRRLEALDALARFRGELPAVQFLFLNNRADEPAARDEGMERCRQLLAPYHALDGADWPRRSLVQSLAPEDRRWLRDEVGELLLLAARFGAAQPGSDAAEEALRLNQLAEVCYAGEAVPRVVARQRAALLRRLGRDADDPPPAQPGEAAGARALRLEAAEQSSRRQFAKAVRLLREAVRLESRNFRAWFDLGVNHEYLGHDADAAACLAPASRCGPTSRPCTSSAGRRTCGPRSSSRPAPTSTWPSAPRKPA